MIEKPKRRAFLVLHRKVHNQTKCICGGDMITRNWKLRCEKQLRFKEPTYIEVDVTDESILDGHPIDFGIILPETPGLEKCLKGI